MDGEWQVHAPGDAVAGPGARGAGGAEDRGDSVAVGMRLGVVELLTAPQEAEALGHLGPDVLGPDWDADEAVRRLAADPARAVHEAVQDQRVMAGPGNVYANEVCFLRGLHPGTPVGAVTDPAALVSLMHRLMIGQPDDRAADHHRRHPAGAGALGVRPPGPALSPMRDDPSR